MSRDKLLGMSRDKLVGIYRIVNIQNGYSYIGQSTDLVRRFFDHIYIKSITPKTQAIDRAIVEYGIANFTFQILELCKPEDLDYKEDYYIKFFQSVDFGYNEVYGGQHNAGDSNSNSKLTAFDVYNIREAYNNHCSPEAIYRAYFKGRISINQFFVIWEGKSWTDIHMDVYTEENRAYYKSLVNSPDKEYTDFTDDEVLRFRRRYVNETAAEIYESEGLTCKFNTFRTILSGQVYRHLPFYNKRKKVWVQL